MIFCSADIDKLKNVSIDKREYVFNNICAITFNFVAYN